MASNLEKLAGDPDSPIGCEVARLGEKQLHKIVKLASNEERLSSTSIHDMRVACRRLRELVKVQLLVDESKSLKKMNRFGRKLGHRLGAVRASDVLIAGLQQLGMADPVRVLILAASMRRRVEMLQLESLVRSDEFNEWIDRVKREFDHPDKSEPSVAEAMPEIIKSGRDKIQAHRDVGADDEFSGLHRLRIDAKHLRYCLEFFSQVPGIKAVAGIHQLTMLQDHLGDLHDKILLLEEIEAAEDPLYAWDREELTYLESCRTHLQEQIRLKRNESPSKWNFAFESRFLDQP